MTVKATLTAAFPEARRISNFLERDYGEAGVAVSLDERPTEAGRSMPISRTGEPRRDRGASCATGSAPTPSARRLRVEALPETDWVAAGPEALKPVVGRPLRRPRQPRPRSAPGRPHRHRDRCRPGLRHRPSRDDGGLPRGARPADRARAASSNPLDLGTGTGVLAIALAKTLRRPVLATDIDPVAVRVARGERRAEPGRRIWCAVVDGGRRRASGDPRARALRSRRRQHPRRAADAARAAARAAPRAGRHSGPLRPPRRTSASASSPPMARRASRLRDGAHLRRLGGAGRSRRPRAPMPAANRATPC